eukprot:scaffold30825_cov172-Isochrysis_galbana.AAC.1
MGTWALTRLWRLLYEPGAWHRARRARRAQRWTWFQGLRSSGPFPSSIKRRWGVQHVLATQQWDKAQSLMSMG